MTLLKKNLKGFISKSIKHYSSANVEVDIEEKWKGAKPFSEIPSLPMLPIIGTAWHYMPIIGRFRLDRQHEANEEKRKLCGDILREKIGSLDIVISFRAEDLQEILRNEGTYPYRVEFTSIRAYRESRKHWFSTAGLLAVQGEEWHHLRTRTQEHLLKPAAVLKYFDALQDVAREFVQTIFKNRDSNNEVPNFIRELYKWTLESVCYVGLDTRLGCLESNLSKDSDGMKMINSVLSQFEYMIKLEAFSGRIQFWKYFSTPTWRKFVKYSDMYSEVAFKYINRALKDLDSKKDEDKLTLIQALVVNKKLDVKDIMVMVADFLMAGIETTSHSAGFLLYHLARNPDKQQKLYEEIMRILPTKDLKITTEMYEYEMKYLRSCFKESLRLNPVVGGTARILAKDAVLSGYHVPAGTLATIPYHELFINERYYEEPLKFIPERWINKNKDFNPFAFVPFGFGPRSCIGKRLAELEISLFVTELIRNFKVEYHYEDIGVKTLLANVPDKPLCFTFIER
ncbi:probable cytochrome P450 49a1 [Trichonephila clavata]|uniref:Probable cytochrome P450 49a1 n=1 Tax=Trichonephila clavata TaxID=2740835 RepID=A0A8X6FTE1_TRICU|nr:probable cytochrome P450 49a1 [Trichonephila clavata]